jgi:hypothetical protein
MESVDMLRPVDLSQVKTIPLQQRTNKVAAQQFARPAQEGRSFRDFLASLPHILAGNDIRAVIDAMVTARRNGRPVILGLGAHVIKCGLGPLLIDLMQRRILTALALNGSGAIHDCEIALIGETSEDVAAGLKDGTFGMVRETGDLINRAVNRALEQPDRGMGSLLGEALETMSAPHRQYSLLAAGHRLGIPVTVHVAVGTDIIHMHPTANGAAIGQATFNDFRLFAAVVAELSGGVYLNVGSSVILPEVFLKAFTVAQNLGANLHDFVTVNLDMIGHYRPGENVVRRPPTVGGRGYSLIGRHEILLPLLAQAVVDELAGG